MEYCLLTKLSVEGEDRSWRCLSICIRGAAGQLVTLADLYSWSLLSALPIDILIWEICIRICRICIRGAAGRLSKLKAQYCSVHVPANKQYWLNWSLLRCGFFLHWETANSAGVVLVDRPTQLICISDIYLLTNRNSNANTNTNDIAGQSANY